MLIYSILPPAWYRSGVTMITSHKHTHTCFVLSVGGTHSAGRSKQTAVDWAKLCILWESLIPVWKVWCAFVFFHLSQLFLGSPFACLWGYFSSEIIIFTQFSVPKYPSFSERGWRTFATLVTPCGYARFACNLNHPIVSLNKCFHLSLGSSAASNGLFFIYLTIDSDRLLCAY